MLYGEICLPSAPGAVDGEDYTARANDASGEVALPVGVNSVTCDIPILENDIREGDETFDVTIGTVSCGGALGAVTTTTVTITDNDGMLVLKILPVC